MKQHITPEQLNELSKEQEGRLKEWWGNYPEDKLFGKSYIPLLSIGQMIEFLMDKEYIRERSYSNKRNEYRINWYDDELCDALWQAIKEVL